MAEVTEVAEVSVASAVVDQEEAEDSADVVVEVAEEAVGMWKKLFIEQCSTKKTSQVLHPVLHSNHN